MTLLAEETEKGKNGGEACKGSIKDKGPTFIEAEKRRRENERKGVRKRGRERE